MSTRPIRKRRHRPDLALEVTAYILLRKEKKKEENAKTKRLRLGIQARNGRTRTSLRAARRAAAREAKKQGKQTAEATKGSIPPNPETPKTVL